MFKTIAKTSLTAAMAAVALAGCSSAPSAEDLQQSGYTPIENPVSTARCYDYSGNKIVEQAVKEAYFSSGLLYTKNDNLTVANAAGCVVETVYVKDNLADAQAKAPITVIATAGSAVVMHQNFSKASRRENNIAYTLNASDGVKLKEVEIMGLTNFGTKKPQGVAPEIKNVLGL